MPDGIPRPPLTARMRRALDDGCLLVVAPAGYGKTLAIQQAVEAHDAPAIFHACRERDADGGRLIVSILEAVRRTVPGAADVLLDQLGEAGETVDPATAAQVLVDDLARLLVEPLVLVVDDVERLDDAPPAMAVLGALLEGAGGPLRLVVASRRRPPLKLAKLTAAGLVTELGEADLVFTSEECAAVLDRARRPPAERRRGRGHHVAHARLAAGRRARRRPRAGRRGGDRAVPGRGGPGRRSTRRRAARCWTPRSSTSCRPRRSARSASQPEALQSAARLGPQPARRSPARPA